MFIAYYSLERHDARDMAAARDVMEQWTDIAGGESRVWLEWARAEAEAGEVVYARHIYKAQFGAAADGLGCRERVLGVAALRARAWQCGRPLRSLAAV